MAFLRSLGEGARDECLCCFYCFHLKVLLNRWDQALESEISMCLGKALFRKALIYTYVLKVKYKPCILFTFGPYIGDIHLHTPGFKVLE